MASEKNASLSLNQSMTTVPKFYTTECKTPGTTKLHIKLLFKQYEGFLKIFSSTACPRKSGPKKQLTNMVLYGKTI